MLLLLLLPRGAKGGVTMLMLAAAALLLAATTTTTIAAAAAAAAAASDCLPISLTIKAPSTVKPTKYFRTAVKITNQGSSLLEDIVVTVNMPVETTVVKLLPSNVQAESNPWTLVLPIPSLAPGKSETIVVKAISGNCFHDSFVIDALATLPSDPLCEAIEASRTVEIKTTSLLQKTKHWRASQQQQKQQQQCNVSPATVLVECGQPLPFLPPDFPMGACGNRSSIDPRVWGPDAWQTLHVMAQNYPTDPTQQAIEGCTLFINALPLMLPSELAGYTLGMFILANNEFAGTYNSACAANEAYGMPCTTPAQACLNQSSLVSFFLRAHHAVDQLISPCKKLWTLDEAEEAYATQTDFCATCIVWGTLPICKDVGETDCAPINTTPPCNEVAPGPSVVTPTPAPTTTQQLTVECGIVLEPSISSWAMGQCGTRTTGDPRVFGPYTWRTLHRFAQHYPVAPSNATQTACVNFVNALPWLIPCPHCGYDFSQFIVANMENADTYNSTCQADATYDMPCTTVETACSTRGLLIPFFLRAHHNVDTHNKPCKPLWSREQAQEAFAFQPNFCATTIVYGEGRVCRRDGEEEGCSPLPSSFPCGQL